MPRANLKVVSGDAAPKARKHPMTILEAVEAGNRLAELEATHRRIAKAVQDENTPARDLASLSRRQMEISREIESLRKQRAEEAVGGAVSGDEEFDPASI